MKYKVGDKVKIIDLKGFQDGTVEIGDIVTITREHPDSSDHHYSVKTGARDIWWLTDEEIELYEEHKMPKYTTEPIDYTRCHPVIAEHLKRGEAILCRVRDAHSTEWQHSFMVSGYRKHSAYHYSGWFIGGGGNSFQYAEPIPTKRKVLMSAEKAVVKLIENGWKVRNSSLERNDGVSIEIYTLRRLQGEEDSNFAEYFPDYLFEEVED